MKRKVYDELLVMYILTTLRKVFLIFTITTILVLSGLAALIKIF
jgi:hypothetical protein